MTRHDLSVALAAAAMKRIRALTLSPTPTEAQAREIGKRVGARLVKIAAPISWATGSFAEAILADMQAQLDAEVIAVTCEVLGVTPASFNLN